MPRGAAAVYSAACMTAAAPPFPPAPWQASPRLRLREFAAHDVDDLVRMHQRALAAGDHQLGELLREGAAAARDGAALLVGVQRSQ